MVSITEDEWSWSNWEEASKSIYHAWICPLTASLLKPEKVAINNVLSSITAVINRAETM